MAINSHAKRTYRDSAKTLSVFICIGGLFYNAPHRFKKPTPGGLYIAEPGNTAKERLEKP